MPALLGDLTEDLVDAILAEAGRFATEEVAPLADIGDRQGAVLEGDVGALPDGWRDLYRHWTAGGWNGLTAPEDFGGQACRTCWASRRWKCGIPARWPSRSARC